MENNFTPEQIEKAKAAKSPEELLALAKECNFPFTEEEAVAYFEQMSKKGELNDSDLDKVSGGGCHKNGKLIVSIGYTCDHWRCSGCGGKKNSDWSETRYQHACPNPTSVTAIATCNNCKFKRIEHNWWLCDNPANYG